MKSTGIVQTVNGVGKVLIPKIIGKAFEIEKYGKVEISSKDDLIIIKKHDLGCVFCGELGDLKRFTYKGICNSCQTEIKKIAKFDNDFITEANT